MLKEFFLKQLINSKLAHLPADQRQQVVDLITKNPDFFKTLAEKVKVKMDSGMSQMDAMQSVMREHQSELQGLLGK